MTPDNTERYLGEYRLIELIALKPPIQRWLAEQTGISRTVLIDELPSPDLDQRADFLSTVKTKASVDHPLVASVYEAVSQDDACFFAHEVLPGASLADRLAVNAALRPIELAHLIRRVAEAQFHIQQAGIATTILELRHIHLDDQGLIRLENTAIQGLRAHDQSARDAAFLGRALVPLVADAQPGATRALTLLEWMRGSNEKPPLDWDQIRDVAIQIEQQLTQPQVSASAVATRALPGSTPRLSSTAIIIIFLATLLTGLGAYFFFKNDKPKKPTKNKSLATIQIPSGRYASPDGVRESIPAFRISPHEVTIGEYSEFLATLNTLSKDNSEKTFDHEDQPDDKKNHLPDDWDNLFAAAKSNGLWNTRPVTLNTPVVGVDWWDAAAYAEWRKGHLPTQEEWFAALHHEFSDVAALPSSGWVDISTPNQDRTPAGLIGMAGSVTEWTRRQGSNPANPLGARKWIVIGGSFMIRGSNALSREWVDDRSLRRPDLGFRLVFDTDAP
jgi:Sulfatase-modifying factor enzyme 1